MLNVLLSLAILWTGQVLTISEQLQLVELSESTSARLQTDAATLMGASHGKGSMSNKRNRSGFMVSGKYVYVTGTLRTPHETTKPRKELEPRRLKESSKRLQLAKIKHHLTAFKEVYGEDDKAGKRTPTKSLAKMVAQDVKRATNSLESTVKLTAAQHAAHPELASLLKESFNLLQMDDEQDEPKSWEDQEPDLGEPSGETNQLKSKYDKKLRDRIRKEKKKEDNKLKKSARNLEKLKEKVRSKEAQRFRKSSLSKQFHQKGKELTREWDILMSNASFAKLKAPAVISDKPTVGIPSSRSVMANLTNKLNVTNSIHTATLNATHNTTHMQNSSELGSSTSLGSRAEHGLSWSSKQGAMKNFKPNSRVRVRKVADVQNVHRIDAGMVDQKGFALVLYGKRLGRIESTGGNVVNVADGFNDPKDVALFQDPKTKKWMAVVADFGSDNIHLVPDVMASGSKVKKILREKMLLKPRRIAALVANPNDSRNVGVRKVYAFVAVGKTTVMRIENILGRKRAEQGALAYEKVWQQQFNKKDKKTWNMKNSPTVHVLCDKFQHISSIASVSYFRDGGTRWLLFVSDRKLNAIFRLEQILSGGQRARQVPVAIVQHPGDMVVLGGLSNWFALVADNRPGHETIRRVDHIVEGRHIGRVSPLFHLEDGKSLAGSVQPTSGTKALKGSRIVGLGGHSPWDGKLFATTSGKSSSVMLMDMTQPLECKDSTLLGSEEFQDLTELQDLGESKTKMGKLILHDYVARSRINTTSDSYQNAWTVVNYVGDGSDGMCGISTVAKSPSELLLAYRCDKGSCWPL